MRRKLNDVNNTLMLKKSVAPIHTAAEFGHWRSVLNNDEAFPVFLASRNGHTCGNNKGTG